MSRLFADGSDMLHATRHPVNDVAVARRGGHYDPDWRNRRKEGRHRPVNMEAKSFTETKSFTWAELSRFADFIATCRAGGNHHA